MNRRKQNFLYRAVSDDELADIKKNGFRNKPGAYETGKLFALSLFDAAKFGKNNFLFDGFCNTLVKVDVLMEVYEKFLPFEADGMMAILIEKKYLFLLKPYSINYTPIV